MSGLDLDDLAARLERVTTALDDPRQSLEGVLAVLAALVDLHEIAGQALDDALTELGRLLPWWQRPLLPWWVRRWRRMARQAWRARRQGGWQERHE